MNIALYFAPNTCALAPFITLTEARVPFEARPLNFRKKQQMTAEYLAVNPRHKVPALVVDGKVLTENVAIQLWIARTFPAAKLLPFDPWEKVKAISILSWCASGFHPLMARINSPAKSCDLPGAAENLRVHAERELHENFCVADEMLAGREFFFEHFTTADAHFFWVFRRSSQLGVDLAGFPNCAAHFARMQERASVKAFIAAETDAVAGFSKVA
ncbi:MAG TPA: glutathione S-transferase N-terminal domain-containing protein [Alphaproteobacteria bacterium]|nr:glutathione S-transferase N-terminal domain-containing protein [Alphaproteobacteria bacterium]